ncbi:hypothetical protein SISSUDRAFT_1129431 [Sistotremastrum suecicum HHB10207 ss-3]|uniref:F-box domain-containing protein n=1 Tax=Sistotremastrum suecicum HHB10207 ss-3 TaxID=1314776 RepID=A0A166CQY1_9AGAM|nr:hypothetical protein SISSUDRAFT_1129431 [Sistotremastrum suecicum HHB10207 ss-3]
MLLDGLPVEMLHKIMKLSIEDKMPLSPKQRLSATLRLGLLNRRLRAVSLNCTELWSTIYLQWRQEIVLLYLQRVRQCCRDPALVIYLDTNGKLTESLLVRAGHWASFLSQNMASIKALHVIINPGHIGPALVPAFNRPAPLLQICNLTVNNRIQLSTSIFAQQAPKLCIAKFRSPSHFKLGHAPSLRVLDIKIDKQNAKGFLNTIEATTYLESLTLVGVQNAQPLLLGERKPVVLPHCRSLTINNMHSTSARPLMSLLRLPSLVTLDYHEIQVILLAEPEITMASALKIITEFSSTLPNPTLSINLLPHRVVVRLKATPFSLCFTSDWPDLGSPFPEFAHEIISRRVFTSIEDMLTSLASCSIQPEQLIFSNRRNDRTHSNRILSHALKDDFQTLVARLLRAYPSVQSLRLHGVQRAARVLLDDLQILPLLSSVEFSFINPEISPETWQLLEDIQEARGVSIHMMMK